MKKGRIIAALAAFAGLSLAATASVHAERPQNRFAAELLDAHNQERAEFGAPKLKWSQRLARDAQVWAERLAREGRMRHANNDERGGAGENLWMGSAGAYSASFMIRAFAEEKRYFRPGEFPDVSRTGNWRDVGHYTQVVWRETQEVGCAVSRNSRDDFLVCRYWPAGNIYGREIR
ncbi:CAP domain-containing protein [Erythrobacter sp. HA6-11]